MKKILSAILIITMVMVMSVSTSALAIEPTIQPLWETMSSIHVLVNFSGTTGRATATVGRIYGITTEIEGTLTVYEVDGDDWIYIDSIYGSSTRSLGIDLEFDATSGTEYVAVLEVTAYSETTSETHTATDYGTCP